MGYTQESLAEALAVDRTTVIRWERAECKPQPGLRGGLAKLLQVSLAELDDLLTNIVDVDDVGTATGTRTGAAPSSNGRSWRCQPAVGKPAQVGQPGQPPLVMANAGLDLPWNGKGAISAAFEVAEGNVMDRRIFLQLTGTALTQPALEWLLAQPASDVYGTIGRRVVDTHVDSVEEITAQLRRMDDQFGGGAVLDLIKSQVRFVLDLLRDRSYAETVGKRLHAAAAELLRLAGWVSFDVGQHASAQRYWLAALRGAHSAGDRSIGANILGFMSCQAKDMGMFTEAVHLAEAANHGYPGASPRVTAIINLRIAEAHAQTNDSKQVQRAIDTAHDAIQDSAGADPAWSYWLDEAHLNEQAGYCYTRLNDWSRAQLHLERSINPAGNEYKREGVLRRALLAGTYARLGEPERACATGNEAIDLLAEDVDSSRCINHLHDVLDALAPYPTNPNLREFRERVTDLVNTTADRT